MSLMAIHFFTGWAIGWLVLLGIQNIWRPSESQTYMEK